MSFEFNLHPSKEAAADFVARVGRVLQKALLTRKNETGMTQQELATRLGLDRSRINRCFSGYNNITVGTFAELVWALDGRIELKVILEDQEDHSSNHFDTATSAKKGVTTLNRASSQSSISPNTVRATIHAN